MHGHAWSCMVMHGHGWSWMVMDGHAWSCMVMHGHAWSWMSVRIMHCARALFSYGTFTTNGNKNIQFDGINALWKTTK